VSEKEAPLVAMTEGGLSVRYRGRLLYSERDPSRNPLRMVAACTPGPMRLYLVCSPLLWYGVGELLEKMGPGSAVLCVEVDPQLAAVARNAAPAGLLDDPRLAFVQGDSTEAVVGKARELGTFRACESLALSGAAALNREFYADAISALSADIEQHWRNRAALMILGRLWTNNIFSNLSALPHIDPTAFPAFPGCVAVCGAGPSLEQSIPFLKEHRGRIAIIACDTALGSLLAGGLEPDLVVCLEGQAHNLGDFTPLGDRRISLAADLSSHPATFRAVRGPKHVTCVRLTDSPFLRRIDSLVDELHTPVLKMPPLGSVGVHAVYIARAISGGPVLACGLDFSFETGKTHARGSPAILAEERRLKRLSRWQGLYATSFRERSAPAQCPVLSDGKRLLSDPTLVSYSTLLAGLATTAGPEIYDIRGRGPSIGIKALSLEQASALLEKSDVAAERRDPAAACAAQKAYPTPESVPAASQAAADAARERVADFIKGELLRLRSIKSTLKGSSPAGPRSMASLAVLVAEADYLYWSFPDADRSRKLPQDFLNRLLPEADYWSERLYRLRDDLRP
jgi:hypothetical protein